MDPRGLDSIEEEAAPAVEPAAEEPPPRPSTPPPPQPPGFYHSSPVAAALRLPDDTISLILEFLVLPIPSEYHTPLEDLKSLALSHSYFLDPVRAVLLRQPDLIDWGCLVRGGGKMGPRSTRLDKLAASLEVNPSLGNWVQHLPDFGELTYGLLGPASISPAGLSKTVLSILDKTPNLISLDLPSVQLKDQEELVQVVTKMKNLRRLKLDQGCTRSRDGTSRMHEGDLRRIAKACPEIEELHILTSCIEFGSTDSWVEGFSFRELRELYLFRATSVTDKHLKALVTNSRHLTTLSIISSARVDLPEPEAKIKPFTPLLTLGGIADVLEQRGGTLKSLTLDLSSQPLSTPTGQTPLEAVLPSCPSLTFLSLSGPSLLSPSSLRTLGTPPLSKRSFGMPHTSSAPAGLPSLVSLSLGLQPPPFGALLSFLAPPPPFPSLRHLTLTNPIWTNTAPFDIESQDQVFQLRQLANGAAFDLRFEREWEMMSHKREDAWSRVRVVRSLGTGVKRLGPVGVPLGARGSTVEVLDLTAGEDEEWAEVETQEDDEV